MHTLSRTLCQSSALGLLALALSSCSALRAPAVATSAFLDHSKELKSADNHSPFLGNWTSPDSEAVLQKRTNIYIAPVNTTHLRPMCRTMSSAEYTAEECIAAGQKLATYANSKLADSFANSPSPRYKLVSKPDKNSITLELAFVELNPNPISGGVLRTAIGAFAAPGVDSVLFKRLKGNIAMEGKVRDGVTKRPIFEFADNQENKSALILSVNDLTSYGQARQAIDEWAKQIEEILRTPVSHRVKPATAFVFFPWN